MDLGTDSVKTALSPGAGNPERTVLLCTRRTSGTAGLFVFLVCIVLTSIAADDDDHLLPYVGIDRIHVLDRRTNRRQFVSGAIEDIQRDFVLFRRGGSGRLEAIPLLDVEELQFQKTANHTRALTLFQKSEFAEALQSCDAALAEESRQWVRDEIQATAVRSCLSLNRHKDALQRVESICSHDADSRYCGLLPLVWDTRLPEAERWRATPTELESRSRPRRLTAASSLLHKNEYRSICVRVLSKLRDDRSSPLGTLAETQLWRLSFLSGETLRALQIERWTTRAAELPPWLRSGAQYLVGRALRLQHEADRAAIEYLWTPLMRHDDPVLSAACLARAVECLQDSGRTASAALIRAELLQRFPDTSSARRHNNHQPPRILKSDRRKGPDRGAPRETPNP